jgi:hypothetical protein
MEMRDVAVIGAIALGVILLKGFYDAFLLNLPPWMIYLAIILFVLFSAMGVLLLLNKEIEDAHVKVKLSLLIGGPKNSLKRALGLWLSWPWWALMLVVWRVAEPLTHSWSDALALSYGLSLGGSVPLIGSPLNILSIALTYACLVALTAPALMLHYFSPMGGAGMCHRCGTLHGSVDNYCSNCGSALKGGRG